MLLFELFGELLCFVGRVDGSMLGSVVGIVGMFIVGRFIMILGRFDVLAEMIGLGSCTETLHLVASDVMWMVLW